MNVAQFKENKNGYTSRSNPKLAYPFVFDNLLKIKAVRFAYPKISSSSFIEFMMSSNASLYSALSLALQTRVTT